MLRQKSTVLIFLAAFSIFSCGGFAQKQSDPFYRYSNPNNRYDSVKTSFPEEEALNRAANRNETASYNYDTGSGRVPLQEQEFLNRTVNDRENNTTYTGTSIPPGINDGYNATPSGVYKNAGGSYSSVLNETTK